MWTIGAEVLHPDGRNVSGIDELAGLLTISLGSMGGPVFYVGCFSALLSSVIGNASGYGLLVAEVVRVLGGGKSVPAPAETPAWRATVLWCLLSPLVWSLPGMPNFVTLTILVNAVNVVVLPFLTIVLWAIAWKGRLMAWYEHIVMGGLLVLALWGTWQSAISLSTRE